MRGFAAWPCVRDGEIQSRQPRPEHHAGALVAAAGRQQDRVGHGFRKFANYRLGDLLYTGACNWDLLGR